MAYSQVDIKENEIFELSPELLNVLLKDHTLSSDTEQINIFWATDNYADRGDGYQYFDQITIKAITGANGNIIVPRAVKSREQQQQRSRDMAEVFTPSWICNKQNNLVDNTWFEREGVFNTEVDNPDGTHSWIVNPNPVIFTEDKTWRDYVNENRLEITCGEAPYLVSRYDTVTGEPIPVERRIGLLDRKLRVVGENTKTTSEWLKGAQSAYQSIYGFEWQGDNLVLAREVLLYTFVDYYRAKFSKDPQLKSLLYIAYIISWNIWQMDGLKGVVPNSCGERRTVVYDLFGETENISQCEGCKSGDIKKHNGTYALIKDWRAPKAKQKIRFIDLIK
ncbi:MAG: restriction endonuclease subunit M [Muribaculaceae bacterium]|nr:restriction endonuclease subunit M [Muribaculaceae bacterium]